ncbi:protein SUPPRESSOR OF GENE SILENCING 3 [Mercurialis annua]|uniref:protein SUPPRESSOR OF GENE SILENCING 3 n=1 Tax=Mercurialis annua TaxID=3986 RepID=UPI00215F4EB8|nr:protein SUPPRESSOR OF GENE SILENCING 3 [Mercurialis annua]XP_050205641.1 protein SUPPRESSOR OF GENE SILENCING 3 [Mercurialis annua]
MSSRGGGKPSNAGVGSNSSSKGKNVSEVSIPKVEQLSQSVADISLRAAEDDGQWEVIARKSKNKAGSGAAKPWGSQNSNSKAWGHQDTVQKVGMWNNSGSGKMSGSTLPSQTSDSRRPAGRENSRPQPYNKGTENSYMAPQPAIPPPLEHGWNWQSRVGAAAPKTEALDAEKENDVDDEGDEDDGFDDSDDELLSEDYDSDDSEKSHETRKKNRWFKKFFDSLDSLTIEEINEPGRQWHCPACQGGPGAIDWFRGLQPLMSHAKTKGSKRVRLHRELAELLDEELNRRGTSAIPSGEIFGKWKGLRAEESDHEIVWPPIVIIMNTKLEQDDNDKWLGMGNQELLDYFSGYAAMKARHSYGPQGHRGMSLLIFESSPRGYFEAERLDKHFADQGTDRNAWDRRRVLFHPGGKRQLYGYMATKEDLDIFNRHSQGKTKLKFEMRSYFEMVRDAINRMSEDNQQLEYLKNRVVKEQRRTKTLEESLEIVSDRLRKTAEENRIVRQRTQMHHEQSQEELDYQEQFFKEQLKIIHEARNAKEEDFEKLQQKEREKANQLGANPANTEEYRSRVNKKEKFIQVQEKEINAYVSERDGLIKGHEVKFAAMKKKHQEEELELEKVFDAELASLMERYNPVHIEGSTSL